MNVAKSLVTDLPAPRKRRWLRFSLRSLLVAITLFAIVLGVEMNRVRKQRLIVAEVERSGGSVGYACRFSSPFDGAELYSAGWFEGEYVPRTYTDDIRHFAREYLCDVRVFGGRLRASDEMIPLLVQLRGQDWLDLKGSGITDVGAKRLLKMKTLRSLKMFETQITDDGLASLATMDLVAIGISGTGITDAGLEHIAQMPHLRILGLGSNRITDGGLSSVAGVVKVHGVKRVVNQIEVVSRPI